MFRAISDGLFIFHLQSCASWFYQGDQDEGIHAGLDTCRSNPEFAAVLLPVASAGDVAQCSCVPCPAGCSGYPDAPDGRLTRTGSVGMITPVTNTEICGVVNYIINAGHHM